MSLEIHQFPCLSDNYGYLIHDAETGETAAIDTPDAAAINAALAEKNWRLTHILNTHWHPDHTGGNAALKEKWGCKIYAPKGEADRIPTADYLLAEGDHVEIGPYTAQILDCPGHTSGHIVYHFQSEVAAFVGDVIFALGCGRLFEGTADQMWHSLSKIRALPESTMLYCAHEYTLANAAFAKTVEQDNEVLIDRIKRFEMLRADGLPTVPMQLADEIATNPFLRADHSKMRPWVQAQDTVEAFAEIRQRKDEF